MSDSPRFTINRTLVMLVPRQPFLNWLNDADPTEEPLTAEELRDDCNVFLIPQFNDAVDSMKWIEKRWGMLFEHMLLEWVVDETMWPENRTLEMFREWFDIETHTMVWDLAGESLLVEDWQEEDTGVAEEYGQNEKIILH